MHKSVYTKSNSMKRLINIFGEAGGFTGFLNRLSERSEEKWFSLEILVDYLSGFGSKYIQKYFTQYFLENFMPQFTKYLYDNITKSPNKNIRLMTSNNYDVIRLTLSNLIE